MTPPPASLQSRANAFLGIRLQIIGLIFSARFIMDTGTRMLFPFIPQFAQGLGLSITGFGWLLFIRAIVGVAGPVFGMWSDRYGRRKMMMLGLLCQAAGVMGLALSWQWWATLPMIIFGLSLTGFLPAQQAYISDQVSYRKRGRALAAVEVSWSLTAIIILPVIGWMIDTFGWRSPFLALSLLSIVGAIIVWRGLPPAAGHHTPAGLSWFETQAVFFRTNVLGAVGMAMLIFIAISSFLTVWGVWLTASFQFDAAKLGLVATGIGLAELVGVSLSSLFIDRIGKQRGSGLGLLLLVVAFALLPLSQNNLLAAISMLIMMGIFFEFTIVSLIPLYSEQVPEARGTVLSLMFLGTALGGAMGAPITTTLWEQYGLWAVCAVGTTCLAVAWLIMRKFLHESRLVS